MKIPSTMPLNKDIVTLLVRSANMIAKSDGKRERAEFSMIKTLFLKVLNRCDQTFLCIFHTLFV